MFSSSPPMGHVAITNTTQQNHLQLLRQGTLRAMCTHVFIAVLPDVLPDGAVAIFLATKTQEIFNVRMDEDIKMNAPYKLIKKEEILKDIFNRAAVCDFQPFKKTIEVA